MVVHQRMLHDDYALRGTSRDIKAAEGEASGADNVRHSARPGTTLSQGTRSGPVVAGLSGPDGRSGMAEVK